jgi:hypothetical protein
MDEVYACRADKVGLTSWVIHFAKAQQVGLVTSLPFQTELGKSQSGIGIYPKLRLFHI